MATGAVPNQRGFLERHGDPRSHRHELERVHGGCLVDGPVSHHRGRELKDARQTLQVVVRQPIGERAKTSRPEALADRQKELCPPVGSVHRSWGTTLNGDQDRAELRG